MTRPHAPTRLHDPIFIPRWVLLLTYAFLVALATMTVIRGSATLDLTQPSSYTPIWSIAVGAGALVAFLSAASSALAAAEKFACAWMSGWLLFLAGNAFFVANGAGWLFVLFIALLPAGRSIALFSKRTT